MEQQPQDRHPGEEHNITVGPAIGQPYNFSRVLETILIPNVIAGDRKLSPGARLLWGVIRRFSFKTGQSFETDKRLAAELGVKERQLRNYCAQLVKYGLLRETQRPGCATCRELLFDARFCDGPRHYVPEAPPRSAVTPQPRHSKTPQPRHKRAGDPGTKVPGGPAQKCQGLPYRGIKVSEVQIPSSSSSLKRSVVEDGITVQNATTTTTLERSAAPDGLTAGAAQGGNRPAEKLRPAIARQNPNASGITAGDRTPDQLAKYLRFQYLTSMAAEPPHDLINSLVKILRARRADHIAYGLEMRAVIAHLRLPATPAIWLKVALSAGESVSPTDLASPD